MHMHAYGPDKSLAGQRIGWPSPGRVAARREKPTTRDGAGSGRKAPGPRRLGPEKKRPPRRDQGRLYLIGVMGCIALLALVLMKLLRPDVDSSIFSTICIAVLGYLTRQGLDDRRIRDEGHRRRAGADRK